VTDEFVTITPVQRYSYENVSILILPDPEERDEFLRKMRDALLAEVDAVERAIGIVPTTADIRRLWRAQNRTAIDGK